MGVTSGIVLYLVIWFLTFLVLLPIGMKTQGDVGEIVPGTPAGAPAEPIMKRKAITTTLVAAVLWAIVAGVIVSGAISVRDIDWFDRMGPPSFREDATAA